MKTLYKFLGLLAIGSFLIFSACEELDQSYSGDPFVHFSQESIVVVESSTDTISFEVYLADAPAAAALNLSVDVSLTAQGVTQSCVEGVDFDFIEPTDASSLTIPAGSNSTELKMVVYDNLAEDSAKYVTLTLASGGDFVMGYPGSELKKSIQIEIQDDDCAFKPENFTGAPVGTDAFGWPSEVVFAEDASWPGATASMARFAVTGFLGGQFGSWGESVTNAGVVYLVLDFTDPLAPDVSCDGTPGYYIETEGGDWGYYLYDNDSQVSTFSTCGGTLTWYYYIDLYQDGSIYGAQYWSTYLDVKFEL